MCTQRKLTHSEQPWLGTIYHFILIQYGEIICRGSHCCLFGAISDLHAAIWMCGGVLMNGEGRNVTCVSHLLELRVWLYLFLHFYYSAASICVCWSGLDDNIVLTDCHLGSCCFCLFLLCLYFPLSPILACSLSFF